MLKDFDSEFKWLEKLFKDCLAEMHDRKSNYSLPGDNFKILGDYEGRRSTEVNFTLLMKHIGVIRRHCRNPKGLPNKILRHRIIDACNYLAMFLITWEIELERDGMERLEGKKEA